jgi:hypothetical protein
MPHLAPHSLMPLPFARLPRRVATAPYGNHCHNSETVVYKAALTFQRGSGGATVMSTLHRLSKEIRTDDQNVQNSTPHKRCVTRKRVDGGSRVNFLCCYNLTRQWASLFVRTGLITSLLVKMLKDRYERSHDLPYRHPEAVAVYMERT